MRKFRMHLIKELDQHLPLSYKAKQKAEILFIYTIQCRQKSYKGWLQNDFKVYDRSWIFLPLSYL